MHFSVFWKLVGRRFRLQVAIIPQGDLIELLLVAHLQLRLIGVVFKVDNSRAAF